MISAHHFRNAIACGDSRRLSAASSNVHFFCLERARMRDNKGGMGLDRPCHGNTVSNSLSVGWMTFCSKYWSIAAWAEIVRVAALMGICAKTAMSFTWIYVMLAG